MLHWCEGNPIQPKSIVLAWTSLCNKVRHHLGWDEVAMTQNLECPFLSLVPIPTPI